MLKSAASVPNQAPSQSLTARRILGVKGPATETPVDPDTAPGQATLMVTAGDGRFSANWSLPDDGGQPISSQRLEWKLATNNTYITRRPVSLRHVRKYFWIVEWFKLPCTVAGNKLGWKHLFSGLYSDAYGHRHVT